MEFGSPFIFSSFFWDGKRKHEGIDDEDRIIEDDVEVDEGEPNPFEFAFLYSLIKIFDYKKTSHIDQMRF